MDELKSNVVDMKIDIKDIKEKLSNKTEKKVSDNHEKRIFKLEKAAFATQ